MIEWIQREAINLWYYMDIQIRIIYTMMFA